MILTTQSVAGHRLSYKLVGGSVNQILVITIRDKRLAGQRAEVSDEEYPVPHNTMATWTEMLMHKAPHTRAGTATRGTTQHVAAGPSSKPQGLLTKGSMGSEKPPSREAVSLRAEL